MSEPWDNSGVSLKMGCLEKVIILIMMLISFIFFQNKKRSK